jgi:hypothetical protein
VLVDGLVNVIGRLAVLISRLFSWIDVGGVDRGVGAVSEGMLGVSRELKRLQTGVVANYALYMFLFGITIFYVSRWLTP